MSDEMKALLSAYAAGTLTDGERKLLFEKAVADQALFDELMEAETMRAAMEGPLAKRALLHALEEEEGSEALGDHRYFDLEAPAAVPVAAASTMRAAKVAPIAVGRKSRRGIWVALAACLVAGTFGAYVYFQRPSDVYVAQSPKPTLEDDAPKPEAPRDAQEVARVAPKTQAKTKAKDEGVRQEAPSASVSGPLLAPPAPPSSQPVVPSVAAEAKKVNEEVATAAPAPPQLPAAPQADAVLSFRDAEEGAKKQSREKSVLGAARAVGGNVVLPVARVVGRRLEIRGDVVGQLYVFLSEGARFRRMPGLAPVPLLSGGSRSFGLPDGVAGTLFVLVAPQRDAELDRLADPHEGAMPVRNWTRISFQ